MRTRARTRRTVGLLLLSLSLTSLIGREAEAQLATSGFFTDPVLIYGGGGHQAPVRSMLFSTPDGSQLLTGGMDKVVHVWNLDVDRSGPSRTLRPPNWRGYRGQVNAIALSPRDEGGNQRLLAVAGYGVLGELGEILLFRYPGPTGQGTGDIEGQLSALPAQPGRPALPGHADVVTSLAFTPGGQFLASSSNDKTVRIWDVATRRQVAVMAEAQAAVNSLAIFAGGTRLVAGGNDGVVRLYDITIRSQPILIAPDPRAGRVAPFLLENQILTVAASPDDRWIVVGTEGSRLFRFDAANLGNGVLLKAADAPPTGPIETLAISPDGKRLATSSISAALSKDRVNEANRANFPTVSCVVEIRSMPDGRFLEAMPTTSNLVMALAFSPDSKRLAYSGGDAQALYIKELAPGSPPPDEITGDGASLWDIGFRADSRALRFSRTRPAVPGQGLAYENFDLHGRFFYNPEPNEPAYRHAVASAAGWTIQPQDQYEFLFTNAQGQGWRRSLNPTNERRWWAYTVIPPGPGHTQPVAAVASDAGGVVLWNLITGERTRFFNGHAGPVYALASSPDGKWLATGSGDQTVRLWSLDGCDRPAPFGARFERRADGAWVVADVKPGGFADKIALKKGQIVEKVYVSDYDPYREVDLAAQLPVLDRESPTKFFTFYAGMPGESRRPNGTAPLQVGTSKKDSPVLSLFPAIDRRWVLWTPRGEYDSSADGDRKFLGWLTNRGSVTQLLAGTFDSIDKFEGRFRQPKTTRGNAIDRLLDPANPIHAVAAIPAPATPAPTTSRVDVLTISPAVAAVRPPGPVAVTTPTVLVNYRALASAGAARIRELWVEVNGKRILNNINALAAPVADAQGQLAVPVGDERDVVANLVAVDTLGVQRVQKLELKNQAPPPTTRKSRLEVVAIGADQFLDKRFPNIQHAESDTRDVSRFLADRLIDPLTGARFAHDQVHPHPFINGQLAKSGIVATFDELKEAAIAGSLGAGDVVAVVIESHFLDFHSMRLLATTEPGNGQAEPPSFSATDLADRLGELTKLGCRAVVLIDAIHEVKGAPWENDIRDWVRYLQTQSKVLVFIASDHGPSYPFGDGHRTFAQGILDSVKAKNQARLRKTSGPMSLFDFQRTVADAVLQQTGRKQHAQCYLPDTLSFPIPFLDASTIAR